MILSQNLFPKIYRILSINNFLKLSLTPYTTGSNSSQWISTINFPMGYFGAFIYLFCICLSALPGRQYDAAYKSIQAFFSVAMTLLLVIFLFNITHAEEFAGFLNNLARFEARTGIPISQKYRKRGRHLRFMCDLWHYSLPVMWFTVAASSAILPQKPFNLFQAFYPDGEEYTVNVENIVNMAPKVFGWISATFVANGIVWGIGMPLLDFTTACNLLVSFYGLEYLSNTFER